MEVPYSPELVKAFWLAAGDPFWPRTWLCETESRATLAEDFIMPCLTMAKASA